MPATNEVEIQILHSMDDKCRGVVVQAEILDRQLPDYPGGRVHVKLSNKWHTTAYVALDEGRIHLLAAGHIYARDAVSFDSGESLRILGSAYARKNVDAIRSEIGGGMFALFIIDLESRRLHVVCDLLACMPLYYIFNSNSVTFATNQFDLKETNSISRASCLEYLRYGYLPFSPSIFNGVNRLGPGQVITVDLSTGGIIRITDEELPTYPPLAERINNSDSCVRELDRVFTRFFSRFKGEPIAAGLSGGYDSRLIAAFLSSNNPYLASFDYPGACESHIARQVAEAAGTKTHSFEIPANAPTLFLEDFLYGMQSLDNLGSSHVFALLDALLKGSPSVIVDGFLGDTILGGGYYFKLFGGIESAIRVTTLQDGYRGGIRPLNMYLDMCLSGYGRAIDLPFVDNGETKSHCNHGKVKSFISQQVKACHSHADMIELLLYRFRGRCLIACGPITFLRRVDTICPFYDTEVLRTCLSVDKKLRAGDRVYNAFWRYRFPELTYIPKENTGGLSSQSDLSYRLTHITNALRRRIEKQFPLLKTSKTASGDLSDFNLRYCRSPDNTKLFEEELDKARTRFMNIGIDHNHGQLNRSGAEKQLYLRLVSLAILLNEANS